MGGKIAKILKQPATKEILRNVGSDAASKGTELLLRKIRGNTDIQTKLDERMQKAKRHISNTIDNAIKKKSRGSNIRYYKLDSDSEDDTSEFIKQNSSKRKNRHLSKRKQTIGKMNGYANYDINNESDYDSDQNKETNPRISKKKKMKAKITNFVQKNKKPRFKTRSNDYYKSVFD